MSERMRRRLTSQASHPFTFPVRFRAKREVEASLKLSPKTRGITSIQWLSGGGGWTLAAKRYPQENQLLALRAAGVFVAPDWDTSQDG